MFLPFKKMKSRDHSIAHLFLIFSMKLILTSEKLFGAFYCVFMDNCQQTVSKLLAAVVEKSLDLRFCIPGSDNKVTINDNEVVNFVEKLFPDWSEGHLQIFPAIPDPFAFTFKELSIVESGDNVQYQFLVFKQKIVNALHQLLIEGKCEFLKGRKALLTKLSQSSFKSSVRKAGSISGSMIN